MHRQAATRTHMACHRQVVVWAACRHQAAVQAASRRQAVVRTPQRQSMRKIARSRRQSGLFPPDGDGAQLAGGPALGGGRRAGVSQELIDALPRVTWSDTAQAKLGRGAAPGRESRDPISLVMRSS